MKPIRHNTIRHDGRSRDAALRRLRRTNRWLIAGSALLTGLFVDFAANAFSGHSSSAATRHPARSGAHHDPAQPLRPPAQAPKPVAPRPSQSPSPSEEAAPEASAPAQEPAPETHEAETREPEAPAPEVHEAAPPPSEPSEPVVSGGS